MKESTTMTFEELSALRDSVNAIIARERKVIDALPESSKKAKAALAKALAEAKPEPIPAEEGEQLEGKIRDLGAARTVEIGAAHADDRKPDTTKLDKAISKAQADLAAYHAKVEAAKEAEPAFEERRDAARTRHAAEVKEIAAKVAKAKRTIAGQERLLEEGAQQYASRVAKAAATDEMAANRLESNRLGQGLDWLPELKRLVALGLDLPPDFKRNNGLDAKLTQYYASARVVPRSLPAVTVTESEPTDPLDERYRHAGVFAADGRQIG